MVVTGKRFHVTQVLALLVVLMVFINVYTFLVVTDESNGIKLKKNGRSGSHHASNHGNSVQVYDNVTSVRTRVDGQKLMLLIPKRLKGSPVNEAFRRIISKYEEIKHDGSTTVYSHVKTITRLQKMLKANGSWEDWGKASKNVQWHSYADQWPFHIDSFKFQRLGDLVRNAKYAQVHHAKNAKKGTQLKVEVELDGGQTAFFKPKWHSNDFVVQGDPYGGKDRFYGEIAAFYLNVLLGYNQAPVSVGRVLNLRKEVYDIADDALRDTFIVNEDGELCFYGVCYYCNAEEFVCSERDRVEGALILLMKKKLRIVTNPWKRAYSKDGNTTLSWESSSDFCTSVMKNANQDKRLEAILDITSVAIFDFLIGNADRHRLELYTDPVETQKVKSHEKSFALIDNGKSFGNPFEDYLDILAPLYQCCKIRRSLVTTLKKFKGALGKSLDTITRIDNLYPLVAPEHLEALDRRLLLILATIETCVDTTSAAEVIL